MLFGVTWLPIVHGFTIIFTTASQGQDAFATQGNAFPFPFPFPFPFLFLSFPFLFFLF
jgi:hypothetical protein